MYKLILMDYSMPQMTGVQCTREIRELISQNRFVEQPYICCMTAYTEKSFKKAALEAGMNDFVVKPIFKNQMTHLLKKSGVLA